MAAKPVSPAASGALVCAAVAIWVSAGALTFLAPDVDSPYVGVLPPLSWLLALLAAAAAIAFIVRPAARDVAPLWLSSVLLLPWLPVGLPFSVFMWTGALALWVWIAILVTLAIPALAGRAVFGRLAGWRPHRSAILAGGLSLLVYGLGAWWMAPRHPGGDEPHHLIVAHSLIEDGDLRIENNHENRRYRAYFPFDLDPHYLRLGTDGEIYSVHAPGLAALVAPALFAFGYVGAVATLIGLAALASALAWLVAWHATRDTAASWFGWAAVSLSVPFFFHTGAAFPDGPAALFLLAAFLPILDPGWRSPGRLCVIGASLAVLPWLHTRYAVLAVAAAVAIAGRVLAERSQPVRRLAAFAVCPGFSAIAWFLFFQLIYGTPNPAAAYGEATQMAVENMVRGIPGLLVDQQFGLIANAPVYLCAAAGLVLMLRRESRRLAAELLLITVPYFAAVACFYMWWAGTTAPARFLVPISLSLVVPIAIWFSSARTVAARTVGFGLLVISLMMTATIAMVGQGAFVFNFRDGMSRVALWLSPVVDLTRALPSLFQNPPAVVVQQTLVWAAALGAAVAAAFLLNRRGRAVVLVGSGLVLQAAVTAAVSLVWQSNGVVPITPEFSGPATLRRYDPDISQLALAYRPLQRLPLADLPGRIVLARTLPSAGADHGWSALSRLPGGLYEIAGVVGHPAAGRIRVRTDQRSPTIADWDVQSLSGAWRQELLLPLDVTALHIEPDEAAKDAVRDLTVRALSVWGDEDAPAVDLEARFSARYGPATLFLLDGTAWLEAAGAWIGGGRRARFLVTSGDVPAFHMLVRNGPVANEVTIAGAAWREQLTLAPGEERVLPVPVDARGRGILLEVTSTGGFRPSEVDPKSDDVRFLGAWIDTR
jgi:hypothetical protein